MSRPPPAEKPDGAARPLPDADEELRARLDLLREENRRLRRAHRRTRQTRYRRTAVGLAALGALALAGAALFPGPRDVLLALAGVGLFSGVLVYYLTPERFIAAPVGERIYGAYARTGEALVGDLGLRAERVYLPTDDGARLFVPQHAAYDVPTPADLDGVVVVTDEESRRGVAVHPTGAGLYREFERTVAGEPAADPDVLAEQLADALVEAFELADGASPDAGDGRLTIGVSEPVYGPVDGFDHPVASFVGVGVARVRGEPVVVDVDPAEDGRVDALVTATWPVDGA